MNPLDLERVRQFVNQNIDVFHEARIKLIRGLKLNKVLKRKNPYLFKAKNIQTPEELVNSLVDATLSSSEEGLFGHFLEELAVFVNRMVFGGEKSSSAGLDLDFTRDGIRYVVSIKSGPNWGNSSQQKALKRDFHRALITIRQSHQYLNVRAILGVCYGNHPTKDYGEFTRICGQAFWDFISGDSRPYLEIIDSIGFEARKSNDAYQAEKAIVVKRLIEEFRNQFCEPSGEIDWEKLVQFNSGNLKDV
jgi:hypothetical protein